MQKYVQIRAQALAAHALLKKLDNSARDLHSIKLPVSELEEFGFHVFKELSNQDVTVFYISLAEAIGQEFQDFSEIFETVEDNKYIRIKEGVTHSDLYSRFGFISLELLNIINMAYEKVEWSA